VINKLSDNANFSSPDVSLEVARGAVDKLDASILAAWDGGHTALAHMHDNELATDEIFRILAAYVNRMAAEDETKILGSGFHVSSQPLKKTKAILAVNDGVNSGSVNLVAKAVDSAGAYIWQYAKDLIPENEAGWIAAGTSTRSSFSLTGLVVATKYYFRVSAVTPSVVTNFCPPVLKVVV
jgi:hypothetical protein